MAVTFHDLSSAAGLKKLDDYLLSRSYISGYLASKDDLVAHGGLSKSPSADYVNVSRWYNHIEALLRISGVSGEGCGVSIEGSAPVAETIATPPAADTKATVAEDDSDDDVDLFGEETEEEKKASEARAAAAKASGKKKESGKSSVLMDIKPWDDETDMKKLEEAVRSVHLEGLLWGASKLMPVGYGIKKLQIMMTIVDDLVSVDTLIEERLSVDPINEYVQSCDIVAFNKICRATRAVGMMLRQSPRRNQRSKGMKVKHVLQVSLLLGLCIWLLFYQMPRLNDGESSSRQGIKSLQKLNTNGIKLGRKDLKPKIETKEEIEDEKQNEGQAEENKPQEGKSDHGKTSVDGKKKETKHRDEEEGRGDKEKDDKRRDKSSVEENGKHHKLERAESKAKNDTGKSKENKTEETTQGKESNVKPSKENASKEKKKQLESEGDGLTKNSSSTEKVSLGEKKANVTKHKELDENSKSNDIAASPVDARSSEKDSASYHNSSPRTAPADDQNQDMELSPSSTTEKHNSVDSSTSIEAPMEAGANTK